MCVFFYVHYSGGKVMEDKKMKFITQRITKFFMAKNKLENAQTGNSKKIEAYQPNIKKRI